MVKKFKILICSTTFLACSAFSAHAMSSDEGDDYEVTCSVPAPAVVVDQEERVRVDAFCAKYKFQPAFTQELHERVRGRASALNKYGVSNLDYEAAVLLYSRLRSPNHMNLLIDLFTKTPVEHRQAIWNTLVQWQTDQSAGHPLYDFYYNSHGELMAGVQMPSGVQTLKEKVLNLPYEPNSNEPR